MKVLASTALVTVISNRETPRTQAVSVERGFTVVAPAPEQSGQACPYHLS